MILVILGLLLSGAMLAIGGTVLTMRSPQGKPAGSVMGVCGAVLVAAAVAGLLFLAAGI